MRALLIALMIVPFGPAMSAMEDRPNPALSLDLNVASVVTILVATWVMTRFIDRRPFRRRALAPKHATRDAAAGLLIGNAWLGVCLGGSKGWPDAG